MAKKTTKRRSSAPRIRPVATNCPFCKEKREPDYKDTAELAKYVTDRGKIIGKVRTGLCAKHQRRIAKAIKRARGVGLLPFAGSLV